MSEKARVFISCGQKKDTEEETIANQIYDALDNLGFEPYIAVQEQRLEGVKENIFRRLANAEYFLFIDFKRERFAESAEYRGSLFSHQELAIATFLDLEILAFQEKEVKKEDGILRYIQANCLPFSDRKGLPVAVVEKVKERNWNPNWRNEMELDQENAFVDAVTASGPSRFYHIKVRNKHKDKTCRNCIAFVTQIKNLGTGETTIPESVELKWKGVTTTNVHIMAKSFRFLDAFHMMHAKPNTAILGLNPFIIDYSGYTDYIISDPQDHEIDYAVFSENFPPAIARFRLHLGTNLGDATFHKIS